MVCKPEGVSVVNNNLCIPVEYNKFDLPLLDTVNFIDVGIDITDVLRINDNVCLFAHHLKYLRKENAAHKCL